MPSLPTPLHVEVQLRPHLPRRALNAIEWWLRTASVSPKEEVQKRFPRSDRQ
jgi:hypothetical protein